MTARIETTTLVQTDATAQVAVQAYLERHRAPFSLRCGALLIDYVILMGIMAFSTILARMMGGGARTSGDATEATGLLIVLGVAILNFVLLTAWRGQTIGKWATGLRIVRMDGQLMGPGRSLIRHLLGYPLSLLTLGIGFLVAAFNGNGRALHDVIAGTVVVRETTARRTRPVH
ncbi:MAG TPA: RDD family protein [Pyrinomonadaceae bacterium]|jgi:uncharacterized RDD family membrane protein YckC